MIKDSGNRTEFKSGAVRDIQEGKGRCDLLPLDIIDLWCDDGLQGTLYYVGEYLKAKGTTDYFELVLNEFAIEHQAKRIASGENVQNKLYSTEEYRWNLVLELAKHFEDGAKKYGDRNWEKGIPCDRYIDSAVRHYCKWRAGWTDEPHDRAFIWNILCCEWTRQKYGWNLERLEKIEHDKAKSGLQCNWADMPNYVFKKDSESKEFEKVLRKRMDALLLPIATSFSASPLTIHVKKEDIRNEDILRQIKEQEAKDQETTTLKEACAIIEHNNACFNAPAEVCWGKTCKECKHYIDPDITHNAVNRLLDHALKSLGNTEAE